MRPPRHQVSSGWMSKTPRARTWVRVWADPQHGDMPSVVETSLISNTTHKPIPDYRITVTAFARVADGTWVPISGVYESVVGLPPGKKSWGGGFQIVVDPKASSWNSISRARCPRAGSLPSVSGQAPNSFTYYVAPATLTQLVKAEREVEARHAESTPQSRSRLVFIIINVLLLLVLAALFVWRLRRRRRALAVR